MRTKLQIGDTFNGVTVISIDRVGERSLATIKCFCGKTKANVRPTYLYKGRVKSCGCLRRPHGYSKTNEYHLWLRAKARAEEGNLPFDIVYEDIVIPTVCPLLEIPLQRNKRGGPCDTSPTLDRIVPKLGYVKGNIWVISAKANRMKNNATPEELQLLTNNLIRINTH